MPSPSRFLCFVCSSGYSEKKKCFELVFFGRELGVVDQKERFFVLLLTKDQQLGASLLLHALLICLEGLIDGVRDGLGLLGL